MKKWESTTDFQELLLFAEATSVDSVKAWAMEKAEPILLDSIQKTGTAELCDLFVKTFPKSKNMSVIDGKRKELAEATEKKAQQESAKIDKMLNGLKEALDFGDGMPMGGGGWERAVSSADYSINELKPYISKMSEKQKSRYNQMKSRFNHLIGN